MTTHICTIFARKSRVARGSPWALQKRDKKKLIYLYCHHQGSQGRIKRSSFYIKIPLYRLPFQFQGHHTRVQRSQTRGILQTLSKVRGSLPADVLWSSFVTHSLLPHECATNEPQRTSARRLSTRLSLSLFKVNTFGAICQEICVLLCRTR